MRPGGLEPPTYGLGNRRSILAELRAQYTANNVFTTGWTVQDDGLEYAVSRLFSIPYIYRGDIARKSGERKPKEYTQIFWPL